MSLTARIFHRGFPCPDKLLRAPRFVQPGELGNAMANVVKALTYVGIVNASGGWKNILGMRDGDLFRHHPGVERTPDVP